LVVVDEAQHIKARTWQEIVESYPNAILLGLTATPCRGDGRGLGGTFQIMIQCPQVAELIKLGHLVPGLVYAPATPDLKGVKTTAGDYNEKQLAERMDKSDLIADIVGSWGKYGKCRKTVCFATSVGHSIHLRDEFLNAGVRAEHIDGNTPKEERDSTLERLKIGELDVVCNCMVLTEGWDQPEVSCCILARPTKHMGLYRQMIGRVLRPAPGKTDAIILDHSGAVFHHGLPEDPVDWTLNPEHRATNRKHDARKGDALGGPKLLECVQCHALREGGKACPNCGFLPKRKPDIIISKEGNLALVQGRKPGKADVIRTIGTLNSPRSVSRETTSPGGPRYSTRKSSANGRRVALLSQKSRRWKSDRGFGHARSHTPKARDPGHEQYRTRRRHHHMHP
jgi:DNA repair protein RadD